MSGYCRNFYGQVYPCNSGVSYGARIGIGIACAAAVVIVMILAFSLAARRRKRRAALINTNATTDNSSYPMAYQNGFNQQTGYQGYPQASPYGQQPYGASPYGQQRSTYGPPPGSPPVDNDAALYAPPVGAPPPAYNPDPERKKAENIV